MSKIKIEIITFCKLNDIEDVGAFMNECMEMGFTTKKYGNKPDLIPIKEVKVDNTVVLNNNFIKKVINEDDYGVYDK